MVTIVVNRSSFDVGPTVSRTSHIADYIYACCPLSDPDVDSSGDVLLVCDVEHVRLLVSSLVCVAAILLYVCFVSIQVSEPLCHSWQLTRVVHRSLQANGKVAFAEITVVGVCHPVCVILGCIYVSFGINIHNVNLPKHFYVSYAERESQGDDDIVFAATAPAIQVDMIRTNAR